MTFRSGPCRKAHHCTAGKSTFKIQAIKIQAMRPKDLKAAGVSSGRLRLIQDMADFGGQGRLGQGLLQHRHASIEPALMHDGVP